MFERPRVDVSTVYGTVGGLSTFSATHISPKLKTLSIKVNAPMGAKNKPCGNLKRIEVQANIFQ